MNGLARLKDHLRSEGYVSGGALLGLDFDGTLAPIAKHPRHAAVPRDTLRVLSNLARGGKMKIAVVSGRSVKDVKSKLGVPGVFYGGNHGLEIFGPKLRWVHPALQRSRSELSALSRGLRAGLKDLHGVWVENKGASLSVHYRGANAGAVAPARRIVRRMHEKSRRRFRLMPGKKVWDIVPRLKWSKGDALLRIARLSGSRKMIFIGDDRTDEEGFKTLGARALSVRVGKEGPSAAQFFLRDYRQVHALLEFLARQRP